MNVSKITYHLIRQFYHNGPFRCYIITYQVLKINQQNMNHPFRLSSRVNMTAFFRTLKGLKVNKRFCKGKIATFFYIFERFFVTLSPSLYSTKLTNSQLLCRICTQTFTKERNIFIEFLFLEGQKPLACMRCAQ